SPRRRSTRSPSSGTTAPQSTSEPVAAASPLRVPQPRRVVGRRLQATRPLVPAAVDVGAHGHGFEVAAGVGPQVEKAESSAGSEQADSPWRGRAHLTKLLRPGVALAPPSPEWGLVPILDTITGATPARAFSAADAAKQARSSATVARGPPCGPGGVGAAPAEG